MEIQQLKQQQQIVKKEQIVLKTITEGIINFQGIRIIIKEFSIHFSFQSDFDLGQRFKALESLFGVLHAVDAKGFVTDTDLKKLPIIADLIPYFICLIQWEGDKTDKVTKFEIDRERYISGDKCLVTYKWIYQLLLLSIYKELLLHSNSSDLTDLDLQADYAYLIDKVLRKLDSAIKIKLLNRGVGIKKNIYAGFDTEYKNINPKFNKLISVQLAVDTKITIKIPIHNSFSLSRMNSSTGEVYKYEIKSKFLAVSRLESFINALINDIRGIRFKNSDEELRMVHNSLKALNLPSYTMGDYQVYSLPRTSIRKYIFIGSSYKLSDLVAKSIELSESDLSKTISSLIKMLELIHLGEDANSELEQIKSYGKESYDVIVDNANSIDSNSIEPRLKLQKRYRSTQFSTERVSVSEVCTLYLIGHLTKADLSMLSDFHDFKEHLDIVNNTFITIGKGFEMEGVNVKIRDTMLLAPGSGKSLESIGLIYNYPKIKLSPEEISNMDLLYQSKPELFIEYAVRDAVIPLIHCHSLEDLNFSLKGLGIPLTLASLSKRYVLNHWEEIGYKGYQTTPDRLIGDVSSIITPKGLINNPLTSYKLPLFITSYKGGRNESFMYGVDNERVWYDYDLISAYTTILAFAGDPDYNQARNLEIKEFLSYTNEDLIFNYLAIRLSFTFPDDIKYPSIPCYVDESTTVYPLKGEAVLTGPEYLLARDQGALFKIDEVFLIPFKGRKGQKDQVTLQLTHSDSEFEFEEGCEVGVIDSNNSIINSGTNEVSYPFRELIKDLQIKRTEYAKGTFHNLVFKEIGNSIYGNVVRGINDKRVFDVKTNQSHRVTASELSNPIIAAWITGFVRSVIGESLHSIHMLGGTVISVTTDGFITDIDLLELKIKNNPLISKYADFRIMLSNSPQVYELKNSGVGMISWSTRGQLSAKAMIKATTGFQKGSKNLEELESDFKEAMASDNKVIEFIFSNLRSAKTIYKQGGHVTMQYSDKLFRLHYDNRRCLIVPNDEMFDLSNTLLDSKPLVDKMECMNLRGFMKLARIEDYYKMTSKPSGNGYKSYQDVAIRSFIKIVLKNPEMIKMNGVFKKTVHLIEFINKFNPNFQVTRFTISKLKNRNHLIKTVPRTKETLEFADFVKSHYDVFDMDSFFSKR